MRCPSGFGASCEGAGGFPASKLCRLAEGFAPARREGDGWARAPACCRGHRLPSPWPNTCT